jgi:hypothetical protein
VAVLGAAEHLVPGVFGVAEHRGDPAEGPGAVRAGGRVGGQVGVEPLDDGVDGELVHGPPGVDLLDDGGAVRVGDEPGLGQSLGGLRRVGVGHFLGEIAVGNFADVPPLLAVLPQPFPHFLFQLEAEVFGESLLDPADQQSGGVDAFDVGGLVGSEQRDVSASVQEPASGWERLRTWAVGVRWTSEMIAEHDLQMKELAHARKRLAEHVRARFGRDAVELFTPSGNLAGTELALEAV